MATSLTLNSQAVVKWDFSNAVSLVGNTSQSSSFSFKGTTTNGTGASEADLLYVAAPTISASGTLNLDLAGSLEDLFGNTITFARVKGIFIKFDTTNTGSGIRVGGAATNTATLCFADASDKINISSTGSFYISRSDSTGWAVTAGTGDILKIENTDGTNAVVLNIAIWGASA